MHNNESGVNTNPLNKLYYAYKIQIKKLISINILYEIRIDASI